MHIMYIYIYIYTLNVSAIDRFNDPFAPWRRGSVYGLQAPTHRSKPFGHHGMISAVHLGAAAVRWANGDHQGAVKKIIYSYNMCNLYIYIYV